MSGWTKAFGLKDTIVALSDPDTNWTKQLGLTVDLSGAGIGLGVRTARFALVVDDLKVPYLGVWRLFFLLVFFCMSVELMLFLCSSRRRKPSPSLVPMPFSPPSSSTIRPFDR